MSFGYESLAVHMKTLFSLIQHHKYSLSELENMVPWEKQVYVSLLVEYLKEEKEKAQMMKQTLMSQQRRRR